MNITNSNLSVCYIASNHIYNQTHTHTRKKKESFTISLEIFIQIVHKNIELLSCGLAVNRHTCTINNKVTKSDI